VHRLVPLFFVGYTAGVSLIVAFCIAWLGNYFEGLGLYLEGFDTVLEVLEVLQPELLSDACNGVPLTGSHTSAYIEGYNQGVAQCNNNGQITGAPDRSNNAGSSSSSSSSQSSGNTLNVHIGK
jgi:hypothetical protein